MSEGVIEEGADVLREDQLRADVYRLLAGLLVRAPDQATLDLLGAIEVDAAAPSSMDEIGLAWSHLRQAASEFAPQAIDDEYHALFLGLGRGELVPFGSWYLTGFLMEKPLSVLRSDLQSLGIERSEGVHESEDHIAALCETMAAIIESPQDIERSRQVSFFQDHILPWGDKFFSDLQEAKSAGFYRSVGGLGRAFFAIEASYLSMDV